MIILVSNDDGVHSEGIKKLVKALKKIPAARIVVAAPDSEKSAASHALTLHRPLRVEKLSPDVYSINGTPTDAIMLAVYKLLDERPAMIVSGINRGANLGEDVHYSGTVSAAMEGAIMGIPAIAVSEVGMGDFRFDVAASFTTKLVKKVLKHKLPKGVVLNVNVPSLPKEKIRGVLFTKLGKHTYGDVIIENVDPRGKPYFWIGGDPFRFENKEGTDCQAYLDQMISITPIKVDMTDFNFLREIRKWKLTHA